jgi:hypothetical protein
MKACRSYAVAIQRARKFAIDGPRVAAVLVVRKPRLKYFAAPGFIDANTNGIEQVLLVTPDGRAWKHVPTL